MWAMSFNAQASNKLLTLRLALETCWEFKINKPQENKTKIQTGEKAKMSKSKKAYEIQFSSESSGPCYVGLF